MMFASDDHQHKRSHGWHLLIMTCILFNVNAQRHPDPSSATDENEVFAKLECGDRSVAMVAECFILCNGFPPRTASLPVNSSCSNFRGWEGTCEPFEDHTVCVFKDETPPSDTIDVE